MDQNLVQIIFQALKNDDSELLGKYVPSEVSSFMCLDLDKITDIESLHYKPPLISIAVYFGSAKCVNFLIDNGSELDATDDVLFIFCL